MPTTADGAELRVRPALLHLKISLVRQGGVCTCDVGRRGPQSAPKAGGAEPWGPFAHAGWTARGTRPLAPGGLFMRSREDTHRQSHASS